MNASEPQGKILIIDDDPDYKQVVTIILESEGVFYSKIFKDFSLS